jgi:hypothetical protein
MKTFFYPAQNSACGNGCSYMTCSQRCLVFLKKIRPLKEITVLPGGSRFNTPQSMNLRSGDLVILYAGNCRELEDLISIRDIFESFKIVLIVGQENDVDNNKCHLLNPRYIAAVGQHEAGLSAVIGKMISMS